MIFKNSLRPSAGKDQAVEPNMAAIIDLSGYKAEDHTPRGDVYVSRNRFDRCENPSSL